MERKYLLLIDAFLIVGSLFLIGGIIGYSTPLVIAPLDGYSTTDTSVLFEFDKADMIMLDDNLEFTSPEKIYVEDNIVINLKPGIYYWKAVGGRESEVRELTIESEINLRIEESDKGYEVVNSGNTRLNVDVYNQGKLTGNLVLNPDERENSEGDEFIGRANE